MGFMDLILGTGNEDRKIKKYMKTKNIPELIAMLTSGDAELSEKAKNAMIEILYSNTLYDCEEEMILEILDPIINIRQKLRIDRLDDVTEIRKIVVNEYLISKDYDMAIYALKRAQKLSPGDISLKDSIAAVYHLKDDFDQASSIWEEVLKESPDDTEAIENYTSALYVGARKLAKINKQDPVIMKRLTRILEIKPDHVNAMFELAGLYYNSGDYKRALEYYKKCLEVTTTPEGFLSVNDFLGWVNRHIGDCLTAEGKKEDSTAYYKQALRLRRWDELDLVKIHTSIRG